ncbi:MAG: hypothetical protein JW811_10045 [Clostridiales bacterium]|nr:hypothetical protein [Clostridiales bacterium]
MNETDRIAEALAQVAGVATVTRGWPKQTAKLPCVALQLKERSAVDTRDNEVYLTKHVYLLRVFAQTMGACDALKADITGAMEALHYTLEHVREKDGETAELQMTFVKLD